MFSILRRRRAEDRSAAISPRDAVHLFHTMHPRTIFIKTLPSRSCVLDFGAGSGSLQIFRKWLAPQRQDLMMYAYSLEKGEHFKLYNGYELGRWPTTPPLFPGIEFSAIFCSHFIEHVSAPDEVVAWFARKLSTGSRLYLEWPSPFSESLPPARDLLSTGLNIVASNFRDDLTHVAVHDRGQICHDLITAGFFILQSGYISLPYFEDPLFAAGDSYSVQAAYWSKTLWCQFVVALKR